METLVEKDSPRIPLLALTAIFFLIIGSGIALAYMGGVFPRLRLSRPVRNALWAVRIFVLIITVLVVYTFVVKLMSKG